MKKRDFILFLMASAILGISQSIDSSVFNNFLNDTFHITVAQRSLLEIPREFPGVMVVFVSALLLFLGDVRIAFVANIAAAIGLMGMGFLSTSFGTMVIWLTIYSMGQHLFMPVSNNIGMNLALGTNMGKKLGQINGVNTAMYLVTSLITYFIFKHVTVNYRAALCVAALGLMASAFIIFFMTPHKEAKKSKRFIIRKKYTLFYWLSILNGARKQIFITFGPWVLIKVFNQGASTFAILGFIVAGIGIFFKPLIGNMIDKVGEKKILMGEAMALIVICAGYGLAETISGSLGKGSLAIFIIFGCFIVDQLLTAVGMARSTYLKKIAERPEDVSPTLSMGISMDHVVSMIVPFLGSFIWETFGYEYVFLGGACIALLNLISASRVSTAKIEEIQVAAKM